MSTLIAQPSRLEAAGNKPKVIDEYIGRINSKTEAISIAQMRSSAGWMEPGQYDLFASLCIRQGEPG